MHVIRWISGTPLAAIVTLGLFLLMATLIRQPATEWRVQPAREAIKITPEVKRNPVDRTKPPRPTDLEQPVIDLPPTLPGDKPEITAKTPEPRDIDAGDITATGAVSGPLIRVAPPYPERCRSRGAQGMVLVQFDVGADGSVINPVVVESSDSCFDRTVLKTVSRWKYPPATRGDLPVARYGVVERFSFELAEE